MFDIEKKYKIIYADPPWEYGNFSNAKDSRFFDHKKGCFDRKYGLTPYLSMPIEEIKALPVKDISEKNAALLLWVTFPCLPWGLDVVKSWGFDYKTVAFTWVKRNKNQASYYLGLGNYTRANAEVCLLGVKGSMPANDKTVSQICDSPISNHSKKPDIIRKKIVQLFGDLPRIELFARTKIHGWDTWGNDPKLDFTPLESYLE